MYHLEYYDPITQSVFIKHHIPKCQANATEIWLTVGFNMIVINKRFDYQIHVKTEKLLIQFQTSSFLQ